MLLAPDMPMRNMRLIAWRLRARTLIAFDEELRPSAWLGTHPPGEGERRIAPRPPMAGSAAAPGEAEIPVRARLAQGYGLIATV